VLRIRIMGGSLDPDPDPASKKSSILKLKQGILQVFLHISLMVPVPVLVENFL